MDLDSAYAGGVLNTSAVTPDAPQTALDAFFAQYYRRNPVTATFTGVHTYDASLPDWSAEARTEEIREWGNLRAGLADAQLAHTPEGLRRNPESLDCALAIAYIDVRIAELQSVGFHRTNPALWTGEAIFGAVSLMIRSFGSSEDRIASLTARLAAIPAFLATMPSVITGPIPTSWRNRAMRECVAAQLLFGEGLREWVTTVSKGRRTEVAGMHEAATRARAAFTATELWLRDARVSDVERMACGEELLSTLLQRGHWCAESPAGLLARVEAAMEMERATWQSMLAPYNGSWASAQAAMAADTVAVEHFLPSFEEKWREIRAAVTAEEVLTWPHWPIRYQSLPAWARVAAPQLYWLHYRSPAPFDRYDVHDYVVIPIDTTMPEDEQARRLAVWNRSVVTLNHVVHHGGMGHHVQNWHAIYKSTSRVGTVAAVDAASRIGMFLGGTMAEGWACYATHLANELGLLSPLEKLSEQHTRVRLLARAIVDLRLHTGAWSFAECVAYYRDVAGLSEEAALGETTKNSMFPATALMYWLGLDAILALRDREQQQYGARFSMCEFHDGLLSRGAIPVLLAAQLIESAHDVPD